MGGLGWWSLASAGFGSTSGRATTQILFAIRTIGRVLDRLELRSNFWSDVLDDTFSERLPCYGQQSFTLTLIIFDNRLGIFPRTRGRRKIFRLRTMIDLGTAKIIDDLASVSLKAGVRTFRNFLAGPLFATFAGEDVFIILKNVEIERSLGIHFRWSWWRGVNWKKKRIGVQQLEWMEREWMIEWTNWVCSQNNWNRMNVTEELCSFYVSKSSKMPEKWQNDSSETSQTKPVVHAFSTISTLNNGNLFRPSSFRNIRIQTPT